jgi:hypothetical protein
MTMQHTFISVLSFLLSFIILPILCACLSQSVKCKNGLASLHVVTVRSCPWLGLCLFLGWTQNEEFKILVTHGKAMPLPRKIYTSHPRALGSIPGDSCAFLGGKSDTKGVFFCGISVVLPCRSSSYHCSMYISDCLLRGPIAVISQHIITA